MKTHRFDEISRIFARRKLTRRQALASGATALAAAGLGQVAATGLASAQEATPQATPESTTGEKITYLFVQSFQSGSIAPTAGTEGRYTVTLDLGLGQTIYFADRPSRDVGVTPTPQFLAGLGFSDENPPNAALLVETAPGETDIAVVELYNPSYDEATHTATYEVATLEAWQDDLALGLQDAPADLASLAPTFGTAHLLIDDCADGPVGCYADEGGGFGERVGTFDGQGMCYNYLVCIPCEPYGHTQPDRCSTLGYWAGKCAQSYSDCGNGCHAFYDNADLLGCTGGVTPSDW